ncbi:MAG: 50S ribosomal protein L14e [Promethearchaeota archaeon]|nr:MAG: 50S ribosomal protein L14e [Candidatus Lokiarchaeota archaeon]
MSVYEIGRVCVKTMGREAAHYCIIVDIIDKSYLLIDGPKVKRRRCNYKHLEPIDEVVELSKGASHEDVISAIKDAGLDDLMNSVMEIPTE